MRTFSRINDLLSSYLVVLIPLSFVVGYLSKGFMPHLKWTAAHMLFTIMFTSTWGLRWGDFTKVKEYLRPYLLGIGGQLVVIPLVAYLISMLMFGEKSVWFYGQMCVAASPAAISAIIWTSISGGNVALAVLLVGTHVLMVPFVAPVMLKLFVGKTVQVPLAKLFLNLMWAVFIPTILSVSLYQRSGRDDVKPAFSAWAKFGMLYMIVLNTSVAFASVPISFRFVSVFAAMALQVAASYASGIAMGLLTGADRGTRIALSYFMGMKNNGAGLVMALSSFPMASTLPVALTIMCQQPAASILDRLWRRNEKAADRAHNGRG